MLLGLELVEPGPVRRLMARRSADQAVALRAGLHSSERSAASPEQCCQGPPTTTAIALSVKLD
jgi:hypothetical protein